MPKDYPRSDRVASLLQRELSNLIRDQLKDPGLHSPSIIEVELNRDLSVAKVFFSVLDESRAEETAESLNHAAGFLRRELGHRLRLRITPHLKFVFDDTDLKAQKLDALIDSALTSRSTPSE